MRMNLLQDVFLGNDIDDFRATFEVWRSNRENIITKLASDLLSSGENEIINNFIEIENTICKLDENNDINNMLIVLLWISILFHFQRSIDVISKYKDTLKNKFLSKNRTVVFVTAKTFSYIENELQKKSDVLDSIIENVEYLESHEFSYLCTLYESRVLHTGFIIHLVMNKIEILMSIISESDENCQEYCIKLLNVFFVNSGTNRNHMKVIMKLSKVCFRQIYNVFENHVKSIIGYINLLNNICQCFPCLIKSSKFSVCTMRICSTKNVTLIRLWYSLIFNIIDISKNSFLHKFYKKVANKLFTMIDELPCLLDILNILIDKFDSQFIDINYVVKIIQELAINPNSSVDRDAIFECLITIFRKFGKIEELSADIFLKGELSIKYLEALNIRRDLIDKRIKEILHDTFIEGIQNKSSDQSKVLSLKIYEFFYDMKFIENIYDKIFALSRSVCEEVRFSVTSVLPLFKSQKANTDLLNIALFDTSETVRINAIKRLDKEELPNSNIIAQLLTDSSYKVKKKAIILISEIAKYNNMLFYPFISNFIRHNIDILQKFRNCQNTELFYKTCSLFPLIAKHLTVYCEHFSDEILKICLTILESSFEFLDKYPYENITLDRKGILKVEMKTLIERIGKYLFFTISNLSKNIDPFFDRVIKIYEKAFTTYHKEEFYLHATESLLKIVKKRDLAYKLVNRFPIFPHTVLKLLRRKVSDIVSMKLLILLGTLGITNYPKRYNQLTRPSEPSKDYDIKSEDFYTLFAMDSLIKLLDEPSIPVFNAIAELVVNDTEGYLNISQYLPDIVKKIHEYTMNPANASSLRQALEVLKIITHYSKHNIRPFLKTILDIIKTNINITDALELGIVISFIFKLELVSEFHDLFFICCKIIRSPRTFLDKNLISFVTYAIIFQNQSLEFYISSLEKKLQGYVEDKTHLIDSFRMITHHGYIERDLLRVIRLFLPYYYLNEYKEKVQKLFIDLIRLSQVGSDYYFLIENQFSLESDIISFIQNNKETQIDIFDMTPCVNVQKFIIEDSNMDSSMTKDIHIPYIEYLYELCTTRSNCKPIKIISRFADKSGDFREQIFPIAFLYFWRNILSPDDKHDHLNKIKEVSQSGSSNKDVYALTEILLRAGENLGDLGFKLCESCKNPLQGLRFLGKYFNSSSGSKESITYIEKILEYNTMLGRSISSQGILKSVNLPDIKKWSEILGNWNTVLSECMKDQNYDTSLILKCYSKLEVWEEIVSLAPRFDEMTKGKKKENSIWFAMACYKTANFDGVEKYDSYLKQRTDLDTNCFRILYLIHCRRFDEAERLIDKSFSILVRDCSIYKSLNTYQADYNLMISSQLVEMKEAMNRIIKNKDKIPIVWKYNTKNMSVGSSTWMRIADVRKLCYDEDHIQYINLKYLSSLISEKNYSLEETMESKLVTSLNTPINQLSYVKLLWKRGSKQDALNTLKMFNILHNAPDRDDFVKFMNEIPQPIVVSVSKLIGLNDDSTESLYSILEKWKLKRDKYSKMRAKMLRLEANWLTEDPCTITASLKLFEKSSTLDPHNYKTWADWAYAASRAFDEKCDNKDYIEMAMKGLLKCISIKSDSSLECSCQLFSLFFRYKTVEISELSKKYETIEQIIPQIICHIDHPDPEMRNKVQSLLTDFGKEHFQSICFNLILLKNSGEKSKEHEANKMYSELLIACPDLGQEALMFSKGMYQTAISIQERWLSVLSTAASAENFEALREFINGKHESKCENDAEFLEKYKKDIFSHIENCIRNKDMSTIKEQIKKLKEQSINIETKLDKFCIELCQKKNFQLSVPGTYTTRNPGKKISSIVPTFSLLKSKNNPRIIHINDIDGISSKFLLKGHEDLRIDQRIIQFFELVNSLINKTITNRYGVAIVKYPIIPIAVDAGLISWVGGAETLFSLVNDFRNQFGLPSDADVVRENFSRINQLNSLQRIEAWETVVQICKAYELADIFWTKSINSVQWLRCVETYTVSTAIVSIAGYIIGLGDRHTQNIMIDRKAGQVIHIDFGDSFEEAQLRSKFPELVPFRLTRMIINGFGVSGYEGLFRWSCENTLSVLRKNSSSVLSQLEVFLHEPTSYLRDKKDSVFRRISSKLSGKDPLNEGEDQITCTEQVDRLITTASDHNLYLKHYEGWSIFW